MASVTNCHPEFILLPWTANPAGGDMKWGPQWPCPVTDDVTVSWCPVLHRTCQTMQASQPEVVRLGVGRERQSAPNGMTGKWMGRQSQCPAHYHPLCFPWRCRQFIIEKTDMELTDALWYCVENALACCMCIGIKGLCNKRLLTDKWDVGALTD